jgi:UDP-N-acetylglucosamine--N-acetylmuramyl-(pentapeptide) pyrophosphoryl-undecaprenol N-acetylglucosamine transferase
MERFFPKDKIILTGNPVRQNLLTAQRSNSPKDGPTAEGGQTAKRSLLILGGSLGARTINEAVIASLEELKANSQELTVVWQTGKAYYERCKTAWEAAGCPADIECLDFLADMPDRYATADLVISRAGASSISEICLLGKPAILVPSPNVAEDHQTHNAMALVNKDAAVLVRDADAAQQLIPTALELIRDDKRLQTLSHNVKQLAQTDSAKRIAQEVMKLVNK